MAVETQPLQGWMCSAYSDTSRLRSSRSTCICCCSNASRAICVSRNVLEISPGQVPSLRGEPQTSSTREGVVGSDQRACAASIRSLVATHSVDSS